MAGLLNIGSENKDDAFYRYKMPRLLAKVSLILYPLQLD